MMEFVGLLAVLAAIAAAVLFLRAGSAETARSAAVAKAAELEKRLTTAQEDLNAVKEDLKRRSSALDDARERANKARKKEAKELNRPAAAAPSGPDPALMSRYAAAVEAADRRAKTAEAGLEAKLEEARVQARKDMETQVEDLKRRLSKMEKRDEKPAVVVTAAVERPAEKPHVPGVKLDLAKLDVPVMDELRRYYKRAVNSEKLLALSDQKLELVEDKLEEIQRRYYAVCRELSLAAVNAKKPQELSDAEAAKLATDLVNASEDATQRRSNLSGQPRRRPEQPRREAQGAPREGGAPKDGDSPRGPGRRRRVFARRDRAEGGAPEGGNDVKKADAPTAEAPRSEAPKAEAPKPETVAAAPAPKTDAPVTSN